GEDVLELVHPGVGEEQRRVVLRNERGALHPPVPPLLEEAEETFTNLGCGTGHGAGNIRKSGRIVSLERYERRDARLEVVDGLDLGGPGRQLPPALEIDAQVEGPEDLVSGRGRQQRALVELERVVEALHVLEIGRASCRERE